MYWTNCPFCGGEIVGHWFIWSVLKNVLNWFPFSVSKISKSSLNLIQLICCALCWLSIYFFYNKIMHFQFTWVHHQFIWSVLENVLNWLFLLSRIVHHCSCPAFSLTRELHFSQRWTSFTPFGLHLLFCLVI